jgi:quinol monooxygenase YgiN
MKKVINARIKVKPEAIEQFLALGKTMVENSNSEPGCLIYTLYQEVGYPQSFIFYEVYENQDAVNIHNASEHFKTFIEQVSGLASDKPQVDVF